MKKITAYTFLIVTLSGCSLNTSNNNKPVGVIDSITISRNSKPVIKEFKGVYRPESEQFISCADGKTYSLKNNNIIDSVYKKLLPNAYPDQAVYLEITANIDLKDPRTIVDPKTIVVEKKYSKNTCVPYEYWCFGTEPFWQIQISKTENLIDFYDPMTQKTTHFKYAVPEIKNGITYYISSDKENKITIAVKKEKCNGAIDPQYNYSAQIQLNDKAYSGCAVKYGEPFP